MLEKQLEQLKKEYSVNGLYKEEEVARIASMEKALADAKLKNDMARTDGIKILLAEMTKIVKDTTTQLAWTRDLSEFDRKLLFQKREDYLWFISFFTDPAKVIENIAKAIEEDLNK